MITIIILSRRLNISRRLRVPSLKWEKGPKVVVINNDNQDFPMAWCIVNVDSRFGLPWNLEEGDNTGTWKRRARET